MSEMNRVQRWRQQQREAGKDALTIWLPHALKLRVEDIALKRHCSPSDLIQQALTTCYPLSADVTDTVTDTSVADTSQLRWLLQQELRAFFGDSPPYQGMPPAQPITDTVTDTYVQAKDVPAAGSETRHDTDTVTDTVTDTHGQVGDGRDMCHKAQRVTDTVTDTQAEPAPDVTDTVSDTEPVTDTVAVTGKALEPFDTTKYRLGTLCPRNHDYHGTGQSLRRKNRSGSCRACDAEQKRERRQARRQEVSA